MLTHLTRYGALSVSERVLSPLPGLEPREAPPPHGGWRAERVCAALRCSGDRGPISASRQSFLASRHARTAEPPSISLRLAGTRVANTDMARWCAFPAAILTCVAAILTSAAASDPVAAEGLSNVAARIGGRLQQSGIGKGSQPLRCFHGTRHCVHFDLLNESCGRQPPAQNYCAPDTSFNSDRYSHTYCKIFWGNGQVIRGCHTQLTNECSNRACIASVGHSAASGFCCCNTSLCNLAYELPPPPPQSPPGSEPTGPPPPPHSGRPQSQSATESGGGSNGRLLSPAVLIAVAVALAVLLLVVAWLYGRRRRTALLLASAAATAAAEAGAAAAGAERKIDRHNCRVIPKDCCGSQRCLLVATPPADGGAPTLARRDDSSELQRRVTPLLRLSEGRFCTVWKAAALSRSRHGSGDTRGGRYAAAIKVVGRQHRRQWEAERDIYELLASAQEQHANVASFIGAADCTDESGPASGLWIVTAYCERGSLYEYLQARTLSPSEACRIAHGTAAGLAFLHEHSSWLPAASAQQQLVEISLVGRRNSCRSPDAAVEEPDLARQQRICGKPSIAHRDLKSANVLLTGDLTPRIVDFGLAAQFGQDDAPRGVGGGGFQFGPALQLVGTLRYMAPEMLEGAVEYTRDALLQCDVYSLGLVLWELLSRTSFAAFDDAKEAGAAVSAAEAAPAAPPSPASYEKPFERELGPQPTLAALQEAVAAHRVRPRAEPHWLRWRIGSQLFETAADCWDADAGARVTASCAEQRLRVLFDSLPPPRS